MNEDAANSRADPQPFSWKRVTRSTLLCAVPIVFAFGAYVVATDCNGFKQSWNMRAVEKHITTKLVQVESMPEYASVEMQAYTAGHCGCMTVHGVVSSQTQADQLRELVLASSPPTEVKFLLYSPLESDGAIVYGDLLDVPEIPRPQ
ncbi:MAG TPA: hypothetical protein VK157_09815 [Phycisphaerales bacterium]|nr:hypothetical protein [Phycisphaerales bacterium]